jgi:DNA-nicking Smr family endonuclease
MPLDVKVGHQVGVTAVADDLDNVVQAGPSVPHQIPIEDHLDLHTFHPREIKSVVEEYINAAHEAGLREVRLIHGRGKGVQRGIVQQALERHPLVVEFWDAEETHLGATVARLRD